MNITIIGAGNMGGAIGRRLLSGGNSITLIDHDESEAVQLAQQLGPAAKAGGRVAAAAPGGPIADVLIILAVSYASVASVFKQYASQLAGKILVDISNSVNPGFDDVATPPGTSNAEEIARTAPAGATVLKAFNTTFSKALLAGQVGGQSLDIFIAGDDPGAKALLADAIRSGGMRPVDAGPLRRARHLESLAFLHMALQATLGTNWTSAVKILG
jgi:predicted dinucleotide-binding enzyme